MLKAQKANADSFLQENIAPTPGTVGPDGFTASKPGSLYPQKPGGGNVEFLSVRHLITLSGEVFGVLIRCDYYISTRILPSLAKEILQASVRDHLSAKRHKVPTILTLPLRTRRCERLRCATTALHTLS